jgi:uncharacterized MAPEG superfamily protein
MTLALWCSAFVVLIPYLLAAYGGYYRKKSFGVMDNVNPRIQAARLTGYGARIYAAQQNAWENCIVFTTTVMIISFSGLNTTSSQALCIIFVLLRISHPIAYLMNLSTARSVINTGGLFCCATLIFLSLL